MKRILTLGLCLVTLMYVTPFFYSAYTDSLSGAAAVAALQSEAPASDEIPSDAERLDAHLFPADTQAAQATEAPVETEENSAGETLDKTAVCGDFRTISALVNGTVRQFPLEDYVAGVVASEMPASFPEEALKSQAIAARTYLVYKMLNGGAKESPHNGADVCDDSTHCTAFTDLQTQAVAVWGSNSKKYQSAVETAVKQTAGQILTCDNSPIIAVFHAASGSLTESAADVWGTDIPYLQAVSSAGGEACSAYHDTVTVSASVFRQRMTQRYDGIYLKGAPATWFTASLRSKAGGIITATCGGVTVKGTDIRSLFGLHSTNFKLKWTDDTLTFVTTGYGHGVGMSQYGARQMALDGKSAEEIVTHYYTGATLEKINTGR